MSRQWHPLFAHLLGLLIEDYYTIDPEVPVSDLPRRGDLLLVRRLGRESPPFVGLWSHLTEWNVLEFKGPTDDAEPEDLELLMHVGSGLTCRINERRVADGESRLSPSQISFWYLAPRLGESFLGHARNRAGLNYETEGLWRGWAWGHPLRLVSYLDTAIDADTLPLRLIDLQSPTPRRLAEVVQSTEALSGRFLEWLTALHPKFCREVLGMSNTTHEIFDWEQVGLITDLTKVLKAIPNSKIIQAMGDEVALNEIGTDRVIEIIGKEQLLERLLQSLPKEKAAEIINQRQQQP